MAKLTKKQTKMHNQACAILEKETLTIDEKLFVIEHWHEGAERPVGESGTFFTPLEFAGDFSLDVYKHGRVLDVCAGIGALSLQVHLYDQYNQDITEIVCLEINPRFVEIGKKILPEATWICADVFELDTLELGHFDCIYGNPPFGKNTRTRSKDTKRDFEFAVIELASKHADFGTFIIPQNSAPFQYSGRQYYEERTSGKGVTFKQETGLELVCGVGIDTSVFKDQWKSTSIITEVVTIDFEEHRAALKAEREARADRAANHTPTEYREQLALI